MSKVTFSNKNNEFFHSLKTAVDAYFTNEHMKKTGDWRLFSKTVILVAVAVTGYVLLLFGNLHTAVALAICVVLGLSLAGIGFSVMHDACHGSYSSKHWVNEMMGMTLNALGGNAFFWKQKHNIIHHTYTNIDGVDDDIAKSPLIRQCDTQKWVPAHKVQHLYLPLVYAITSLAWTFIMDFVKYFGRHISGTSAWKMKPYNHFIFWLSKILYLFFYVALPIYFVGFKAWLVGYLVVEVCLGFTLAIVFQLAHVVEKTEFEYVPMDTDKHLETAWAEHQLKTTANFAMSNKIINWFVGGLNFQVEHHLFPRISHIHYPAISKIVQEKCREFNMPYHYYNTMGGAVASHFRFMKYLGKKPVTA